MLIAKEPETSYTPISAGTVQAVAYDIWDIGWQEGEWKGRKNVLPKIIIAFEVSELIDKGEYQGRRMTINKFYTLSLGKKSNLRKDLEGWRGRAFTEEELKGFDLEKLIGVNAMLSIIHKENGNAKISGISKLMAGLTPMVPENNRSIPQWVKEFQDKAVENPFAEGQTPTDDDDIPF